MKPKAWRDAEALVIGAGHNGLTCAAYLAAAGLTVSVLERRHVVGGAAVTETFHPGFRNSVAAYTVSLLHPKVIRDLDLTRQGLEIVEREVANFLPTRWSLPAGRGGANSGRGGEILRAGCRAACGLWCTPRGDLRGAA